MNTATAITIAALAALTPTVTCLIGIILQRQDVRDLRSEMGALRNSLQANMSALCKDLQADMAALRRDLQNEMQAFRKDVYADFLVIHEQVAHVEGRQAAS